MKKFKDAQGITLIALVITIIVLLILAGITITALTGENGIITKAKEAADKTKEGAYKEAGIIQDLQNYANGVTDEGGYFTQASTITGSAANSSNPTIPAGFKPVNTDTANWGNGTTEPTQNAVNAGLVIEDREGNQFVWIPVDGTNLTYEKHTYAVPKVDDTSWKRDEGNGNWPTYHYRNWTNWTDSGGNSASVAKYKGFYLARYEAGVPEDANFYANQEGATYYTSGTNPSKNVTSYVPVSKKNNQAWNYISQEKAKIVAANMYAGNTSVTSSLVDGYAWDTVSQWLSNSGHNVASSTSWGNYYDAAFTIDGLYALHSYDDATSKWTVATNYNKGSHEIKYADRTETATGISDRNKANNIYDFAGNMYEWTTETGNHDGTTTTVAVLRGGCFSHNGDGNAASCRNGYYSSSLTYVSIGFRVVLYVQ